MYLIVWYILNTMYILIQNIIKCVNYGYFYLVIVVKFLYVLSYGERPALPPSGLSKRVLDTKENCQHFLAWLSKCHSGMTDSVCVYIDLARCNNGNKKIISFNPSLICPSVDYSSDVTELSWNLAASIGD